MKRAILFLLPALIISMMTGCGLSSANNTAASETAAASEESISSETAEGVPLSSAEKPQKEIKPLVPTKKQSYFQNDTLSLCAELDKLESSLYYPDIVHDYGANQKLFVMTVNVKVKNISHEDISFDLNDLSLVSGDTELFLCDTESEKFNDISSGKSASESVRFLCSLEQAAAVSGFLCGGKAFEAPENFIPDDISETIAAQSAEDLRTYLYREYVMYADGLHINYEHSLPCFYNLTLSRITAGDGYYFAVRLNAYNRSDYAQLIEPSAFRLSCRTADGSTVQQDLSPKYICTNEDLMYLPQKAEKIDGIKGQPYITPDFMCMEQTGATDLTLIYDAGNCSEPYELNIIGTHNDMPCYNYPLENMTFTYTVAKASKNTESLHFKDIRTVVYDNPELYNKNDPLTEDGAIVIEKQKLKDNQIEYSSDKLTVLFEFTGAENLSSYPKAAKLPQYSERNYVLHAKVTVTNNSKRTFDFIPQNLIIYSKNGSMLPFTYEDRGLICSDGYYTVDAGETVAFDVDLVGDADVIENADKIKYTDYLVHTNGDVDESKLNNLSSAVFEMTDRLAVQKAVSSAKDITEEELGFPDILLPDDTEHMLVTDNYSYCYSAWLTEDKFYLGIKLRVKCLTDEPKSFEPYCFKLETGGHSCSLSSKWIFDEELSPSECETEYFPNDDCYVCQPPFDIGMHSDGTAEYTMYFFVANNYENGDTITFSYEGKNDSFKEYFTLN